MLHFCGVKRTLLRAIVGTGAFCLFSPSQWENFTWAFQISFLLPGFLLLVGLSTILKYHRSVEQLRPRWIYLAFSILAAAAATYSNANGILLWPLLLFVAIALVPRREVIASYVGFGIAFIASYLYHYASPTRHSSPVNSLLHHPLGVCHYVVLYLGTSWVPIRSSFVVYSGMLGLLVALAVTVRVVSVRQRDPLQIALGSLIFFAAATAFLTGLGRLNFGLGQAFAPRYQTFNLLFWFSILSLLLLFADKTNPLLRTSVLAAISAALLSAFFQFPAWLNAGRTRNQQAEAAAAALLSNVADKDAVEVLYFEPMIVLSAADYFRQEHLFMFLDMKNDQMGQLISSSHHSSPQQSCEGQVTTVERIRPEALLANQKTDALEIYGSATNRFSGMQLRRFLFVSNDEIIGYGASIAAPFTSKQTEIVRKDRDNWLGFARPSREAKTVDVYATDGHTDTVCHVAKFQIPQR